MYKCFLNKYIKGKTLFSFVLFFFTKEKKQNFLHPLETWQETAYQKLELRSSHHGFVETNLICIHEDAESDIAISCGVGHRWGSDLALPCLQWRPVDTALIQPLAWECLYAMGTALKKKKKTKKWILKGVYYVYISRYE